MESRSETSLYSCDQKRGQMHVGAGGARWKDISDRNIECHNDVGSKCGCHTGTMALENLSSAVSTQATKVIELHGLCKE